MKWQALVLLGLVTAVACVGPRPILYPNDHLKAVGQAAARLHAAVAACKLVATANPGYPLLYEMQRVNSRSAHE